MNLKRSTIVLLILIIGLSSANSQKTEDLYMPKEIKKAYQKGTRSFDGKPGKNYFINKIDYKIKAEFDPETRILTGEETIDFKNNSPDSLNRMYFNLYQDLYKKGNMRDWDISGIDIHDGVQITKILYNDIEIDLNSNNVSNRASILRVILPESIAPDKSAKIIIHWNFILPKRVSIRMGTYGDKNFFIAYWFPKVAVYDDIDGWNTQGHSGNQEFYNDFGNYEVEITIPGKYNVWSTGILQNAKEILTDETIKKFEQSKKTEDIIHIISEEDRKKETVLKKNEEHIWKFKSENTPDFAFSLSKTYLWDATSLKSGERRISVNAVYKPDSKDFHEVAEISRNVVDFFSNEIPAIPYPYPQLTAFNGGGGMEFPGMVNDGDSRSRNGTLYLTSHEIGHSYYPFYTGLNEQKYAWMDEGLISFFPKLFVAKYTEDKDFHYFKDNIAGYNMFAGTFNDVPLMISSNNVGRYALRFHAYTRPSIAFYILYNYLGKDTFTKGLQLFTKRWNGKHPTPYDFFFTFNEVAGENLAWFWKPWFFELGVADLTIGKTDFSNKGSIDIIIKNKSGFPVPVNLIVTDKSGKEKKYSYKANVWSGNKNEFQITVKIKNIKKIALDTEYTPDAYPNDNYKVF